MRGSVSRGELSAFNRGSIVQMIHYLNDPERLLLNYKQSMGCIDYVDFDDKKMYCCSSAIKAYLTNF